jgi:hypothetical protein
MRTFGRTCISLSVRQGEIALPRRETRRGRSLLGESPTLNIAHKDTGRPSEQSNHSKVIQRLVQNMSGNSGTAGLNAG